MHKCQSTSDSSRNPSVYAQKADFRDCFCLSGPRGPVTFLSVHFRPASQSLRLAHPYLGEFFLPLRVLDAALAASAGARRHRTRMNVSRSQICRPSARYGRDCGHERMRTCALEVIECSQVDEKELSRWQRCGSLLSPSGPGALESAIDSLCHAHHRIGVRVDANHRPQGRRHWRRPGGLSCATRCLRFELAHERTAAHPRAYTEAGSMPLLTVAKSLTGRLSDASQGDKL